MQVENLLRKLEQEEFTKLRNKEVLMDAKCAQTRSYEVVVVKKSEKHWDDEFDIYSYYERLEIYFRKINKKRIWKLELDRKQTKCTFERGPRILGRYPLAKVEVLEEDNEILAGWADESGHYGPSYLIDLREAQEQLLREVVLSNLEKESFDL